jgi:YgiT-type zinc finger domain-containing protein
MICDVCGKKGARIRRVTRSFGKGRLSFFIENVPVVSCPYCGESYLTAETAREIERIRMHWRQLSVEKRVSVAKFGGAAQGTRTQMSSTK